MNNAPTNSIFLLLVLRGFRSQWFVMSVRNFWFTVSFRSSPRLLKSGPLKLITRGYIYDSYQIRFSLLFYSPYNIDICIENLLPRRNFGGASRFWNNEIWGDSYKLGWLVKISRRRHTSYLFNCNFSCLFYELPRGNISKVYSDGLTRFFFFGRLK